MWWQFYNNIFKNIIIAFVIQIYSNLIHLSAFADLFSTQIRKWLSQRTDFRQQAPATVRRRQESPGNVRKREPPGGIKGSQGMPENSSGRQEVAGVVTGR